MIVPHVAQAISAAVPAAVPDAGASARDLRIVARR